MKTIIYLLLWKSIRAISIFATSSKTIDSLFIHTISCRRNQPNLQKKTSSTTISSTKCSRTLFFCISSWSCQKSSMMARRSSSNHYPLRLSLFLFLYTRRRSSSLPRPYSNILSHIFSPFGSSWFDSGSFSSPNNYWMLDRRKSSRYNNQLKKFNHGAVILNKTGSIRFCYTTPFFHFQNEFHHD